MIPLIRSFVHELLWSPERVRVWLRGALGWLAVTGAQVVAVPMEQVMAWRAKDWALRFLISGVAGFALLIKAGDKNRPEAHVGESVIPADLAAQIRKGQG